MINKHLHSRLRALSFGVHSDVPPLIAVAAQLLLAGSYAAAKFGTPGTSRLTGAAAAAAMSPADARDELDRLFLLPMTQLRPLRAGDDAKWVRGARGFADDGRPAPIDTLSGMVTGGGPCRLRPFSAAVTAGSGMGAAGSGGKQRGEAAFLVEVEGEEGMGKEGGSRGSPRRLSANMTWL